MRIKKSIVVSEPETEPITIEAAKSFLRVEDSDEDSLIDLLRRAAREHVEQLTGLSLTTQTREIKLDCFPYCDTIRLTHGPFQSLESVRYYDVNDAIQMIDPSMYWFDDVEGRIQIKNSWPSTKTRQSAVSIEYIAGYDSEKVPGPIMDAMKIVMGYMFENRDQRVPRDLVDTFIGQYVIIEDVSY